MKQLHKILIKTGIISILLFIAGKLFFAPLFGFFEPHVDGIDFRIRELDRFVNTSTLFSMMLAIITLLIVLMWKYAPMVSLSGTIISLVVILLCMTTGIILRHFQVKNYFIWVVKPYFIAKGQSQVDYPIDPLNFVYYMLAGFCVAYLLCWWLLKQKNA